MKYACSENVFLGDTGAGGGGGGGATKIVKLRI